MTRRRGERAWHFWSHKKLELLARYLDQFTTASKRSREIVYLDAFAGDVFNIRRDTGEEFDGSAKIALKVDNPPFTKLRYFEMPPKATRLRAALTSAFPRRDIKVYEGDCNTEIPKALKELEGIRWAPTFAFLDPDGMELKWPTLEALADHKRGHSRFKVELWMLFSSSGILRNLPQDPDRLQSHAVTRVNELFGTEEWQDIYIAYLAEAIDGAWAREEYVNLMRWRLQHVLGYRRTHQLEVRTATGVPLYHMVFATDNAAGDKIMSHMYADAVRTFPEMERQAREQLRRRRREEAGVTALFDLDPVVPVTPEKLYIHEEPWPPFRQNAEDE